MNVKYFVIKVDHYFSKLAENPENGANFFSRWFFFYLHALFKKGQKIPLQDTDVPYPMGMYFL